MTEMTDVQFQTEIAKAVNGDPTANPEIQQFWARMVRGGDEAVPGSILNAVAYDHGVAALCAAVDPETLDPLMPVEPGLPPELALYTWANLHKEVEAMLYLDSLDDQLQPQTTV